MVAILKTTQIQEPSSASANISLDSSGNVGIGTATPAAKLDVNGVIRSTSGANVIEAYADTGSSTAVIRTTTSFPINFQTNSTERARITSAGQLMIGTASTTNLDSSETGSLQITTNGSTSGRAVICMGSSATAASNWHMVMGDNSSSVNWYNGNYGSGTVEVYFKTNGGIANFSANNVNLSDERAKKNIQLAGNYLDKICAIPVKTFEYIDDKRNLDGESLGVIAQDVEKVAPELVDDSGFGETPEDGIPLKAIYQTDLQYALMKSIQELKALVDAQAAEITALKAKVGA